MTCYRDEVDFLLGGQVHDRRHNWTEQNVHMRLDPFPLQTRLNCFEVIPGLFQKQVDCFLVQRADRISYSYCCRDELDDLEQENLRLVVTSSQIYDALEDCFSACRPIQGH